MKKLDLREKNNSNCIRQCGKDDRKENTEDDICKITISGIDNLPVRCVGGWAFEKIYYVTTYFNIFATGMKNSWTHTNYIEVCSGPGRCINRENGEEFDGTSLSVINSNAFSFLKKAVFIDNNPTVIDVLNKRIKTIGKEKIATAIRGDYNNCNGIKGIISEFLVGGLNLVFIDPTDCSVPFATIKIIKETLENVDLIINVAFGTDVKRNIISAINNTDYSVRKKYSDFLGYPDYFSKSEIIKYAKNRHINKLTELFLEDYKNSLRKIDYKYFDTHSVEHYYLLLFASKNKRGLDFWEKAKKIEPYGQRTFNWD